MNMFLRIFITALFIWFVPTYASVGESNSKKIPIDFHVDHPDHVPHGGKDPIKKTSQDEIVFPRRRKKWKKLVIA